MNIPKAAEVIIDLGPVKYQASLDRFRILLEDNPGNLPFRRIAVRTPRGEFLELQVRTDDAYIIGFLGGDDWYSFEGEQGGWGPSCGLGGNYSGLGEVGQISYADLK